MSYERLAVALLRGKQYYGSALRSLQGVPERHRCMQPLVDVAATRAGNRSLWVLEIGSWAGGSAVSWAVALKARAAGGRVMCVDTWEPYFDLAVQRDAVYVQMTAAAEQGDVYRLFLHNIRAAGVADVIEHQVGASSAILPQLETGSFDIVYVDGSHAVEDVLSDLAQAQRLVRNGGIVCGDDLELQRDAVNEEEHAAALASSRDFIFSASGGAHYHPGVTEGVARALGPVFCWNGFWAARREGASWGPFPFEPDELPAHIAEALAAEERERSEEPALLEERPAYNLVRVGRKYLAVAKSLGPVDLATEKLGARSLAPHVLVAESMDELRSTVANHEHRIEAPELVHETETYNVVRCGSRYVAAAKVLGPVCLLEEPLGARELPPYIYVDESLAQLVARLSLTSGAESGDPRHAR